MKKLSIFFAAVAMCATAATAFAQEGSSVKVGGFIRNYFDFDTRNSKAGTGDLYYWTPLDVNKNANGEDLNAQAQFRFLSLTSRLWVDAKGFKVGNADASARIEADFYAGLTDNKGTAQMRLRQAFMTLKWKSIAGENSALALKMGQAWHPMAADLPDIFSLESGCPFNAFSRTPQVTVDFNFDENYFVTASALWQMQYTSTGPAGASTNYMKYGVLPEFYFALNYKGEKFLGRVGVDILSIKPRYKGTVGGVETFVKDRITTASPYVYIQYTDDMFKLKAKSILSSAGEHINLMSGYAVCDKSDESDYQYTPFRTTSSWVTVTYGKKIMGAMMLGYNRNLGTSKDITSASDVYFQANAPVTIHQMVRVQPEVTFNIGKFTLGLEYMMTTAQFGKNLNSRGVVQDDLHWVTNHRLQMMTKFTF